MNTFCPQTGRMCEMSDGCNGTCRYGKTFTYTPTTGATLCAICGGLISGIYGGAIHSCNCPKHAFGWECPRCHMIHAPFVKECYCQAPTFTSSGVTSLVINPTN